MTDGAAAWHVVAALVLTGCAATAPVGGDGPAAVARFVASRARDAQVVYLGESHDNPHHHLDQERVLVAMLADGARPAVAFEMLSQDQQPTVDEAMAPGAEPATLPERLKWQERGWPDFTLYRPLFDLARRYGLPVVALDLDPPTVRRIAKGGLEALPAGEPPTSAGPNDEPDEARGRKQPEAYVGVRAEGQSPEARPETVVR